MKLKIKTITPLHVGNGAEYGSPEFYLASANKRKVLARADLNKLFMILPDDLKDEFIIELEEPQFNLQSFLKEVMFQLPQGSLGKVRLYFSYLETKLPDTVTEHIKTSNQAYIPGTSIKGSIKTALLYDMVKSGDMNGIEHLFRNRRDGKLEINIRKSQNFVDDFFSSDHEKKPNTSIMRFIQVTDTTPVEKMTIYSVNSVKAIDRGWNWYRGSIDAGKTCIESIDKNQELEFDLNLNQTDKIVKKLNLKDKEEYMSLDRILNCIYKFSRDLIENEIEFAQKYGMKFLEKFYSDLSSKNTTDGPVMNIGMGTGFLAKTIGLKIREYDPYLYNKVRQSTRGKSYPNEFPKTRKVIQDELVPPGWVKVEKV